MGYTTKFTGHFDLSKEADCAVGREMEELSDGDCGAITVEGEIAVAHARDLVPDQQLKQFRDFVLGSEWREKILEAWQDR